MKIAIVKLAKLVMIGIRQGTRNLTYRNVVSACISNSAPVKVQDVCHLIRDINLRGG